MADASARALWLRPPHDAVIESETLASPASGQLVVRTRYTAVSRGTETLVYTGAVPVSEYERMRAPFQSGTLPGPVKHGYANVGVVESGPDDWRGRTVFCLYPHQTRYVVDSAAVIPLPDDVPSERAVLAANMETAVNACWDAGVGIGDRVSIVGAGVIGALTAALVARLPGTDVELIDIHADRARLADAIGVRFAEPAAATGERDHVIHASASQAGLDLAIAIAGFEATVLELSWYGTHPIAVPLGGGFHSRRLTLKASQVGAVAPSRRARRDHRDRLALALSLLADPRFDALIDAEADFDTLPAVMARLARADDRTLCQRIRYPA